MESKRKKAIQAILESIKTGKYSAGQKLPPERELAEELGVGRNLLREAVGALEALGVLEVKERLGIFVSEVGFHEFVQNNRFLPLWSSDLVSHFFEMRLITDVPAAELAAGRRTEMDLQKMWECFHEFEKANVLTAEGRNAHGRCETLLHSLVVTATHNPILIRFHEGLVLAIKNNTNLFEFLTQDAKLADQIVSDHRRILEAIEKEDAKLAGQIARQHLLGSMKRHEEYA